MSETQRRLPSVFVAAVVAAAAAVFLQGVTAGLFVNQQGRDSWVTVHGVIADITWVTALVAAVVGLWRVRAARPTLAWAAAALFVLTLAQTGIGHLITDGGQDGLIVIHVPMALLIFLLSGWLLAATLRARSDVAVDEPYATERVQPSPVTQRR